MKLRTNNEYIRIGDIGVIKIRSDKYGLKRILFDWEDYDRVKCFYWSLKPIPNRNVFYAHTVVGNSKTGFESTFSMHRFLMSFPENLIDHISGNGLDNRKSNLREATLSQNNGNRANKPPKGIRKWGNGFAAIFHKCSGNTRIGVYPTEELAISAYREFHIAKYGEFSPFKNQEKK